MTPAPIKPPLKPKPSDLLKPKPPVTAGALSKSLQSILPKADRRAFREFMRRMKGDK